MFKQTWISVAVVAMLVVTPLTACGGDDDEGDDKRRPPPIAGNFVGEVRATNAFVAVMTSPPRPGRDRRNVTVYVSDGRRINESFRGPLTSDSFAASSDDDDARANGRLRRDAVTGTIKLPGRREAARFEARRATGGSGLYDLTVSRGGKLRGTSAAGLLLTGDSTLPRPGRGTFKLVDGRRIRFVVGRAPRRDAVRIRPGGVRLIVLPNGRLRGAGKAQRSAGRGGSDFFIRSSK